MRRTVELALLAALFAVGAGVALGAVRDSAPPISSTTIQDPVGDAQLGGPDISSVAATVSAGGTLTVTVALANEGSLQQNENLGVFLSTESGTQTQLAFYPRETDLMVVVNNAWQTIHELPGGFVNGVATVSISLSDLRDSAHAPVTPDLQLVARAFTFDSSGVASVSDVVPGSGTVTLETAAPVATQPTTQPKPPYIAESYQAVEKSRVEWKRLAVEQVPANANVTIGCKKVCKLFEQLHVAGGAATSKTFVGVPFPSRTSFVVRVNEPGGTGYWFQRTVVGKKGQQIATATGCILGGELESLTSC